MRFKLVKCLTQGYPTGGKRTRLVANPTLVQLLALNVSHGHSRTQSRPPSGPPLLPSVAQFFLAAFSLYPGCSVPPAEPPGADKSPTEAMWLWARVSTEQGQSEGLL